MNSKYLYYVYLIIAYVNFILIIKDGYHIALIEYENCINIFKLGGN